MGLLIQLCTIQIFAALSSNFALATGESRLEVDAARINKNLQELSEFGKNQKGGVSRVAYSDSDKGGRQFVLGLMKDAGLEVRIDQAGNLVAFRKGSDPSLKPIVLGSHIDTVPEGGNYDGNVGSLSAIEVAHVINGIKYSPRHPIEVIVFQNEEGGHLGSRAITSGLTEADLNLKSLSGKTVRAGIEFIGGSPNELPQARMIPGSIAAYLELHIEQGGVLEARKMQIGVVEGIVGIRRWNITVEGMANHAGTTPMDMRKDALVAAAQFIVEINKTLTQMPGRQVGTVERLRPCRALPMSFRVAPNFLLRFAI